MNRDSLRTLTPYLSIFGLFVLLSSLVAPILADRNDLTPPDWLAQALAIAGLILLILPWPLFRMDDVKNLASTRQARYGSNALVLSLSVLAILGVLNFFGTRYFRTWDLTANKQFTISDKTVQIVEGLADTGKAVRVTAVLPVAAVSERGEFERLGEQYRQKNGQLDFDLIDPQLDVFEYRSLSQRVDPESQTGVGSRVIVAETGSAEGGDYQHALVYSSFDEQAITEALVKTTREDEKTVAFVAGHDEYRVDQSDPQGRSYTGISRALEREGYAVETLNLLTLSDTIKADALVLAGPQAALNEREVGLLSDFVQGGGALMLLLEPGVNAGLGALLAPWGLSLNNDVVLDPLRGYGGNAQIPAVTNDGYQFHTITKDLTGSEDVTVFAGASSIAVGEAILEGATTTTLFQTSSQAWGETNLEDPQAAQGPEDNPGPLTLGVAGELGEEQGGGRLVVVSTANLASDALLQQLQMAQLFGTAVKNGDVMLNSVNWLAQDELLIGIEPTPPDSHPLSKPANPLLLFLSTALLVPLVVAGIGFWIWWGRR